MVPGATTAVCIAAITVAAIAGTTVQQRWARDAAAPTMDSSPAAVASCDLRHEGGRVWVPAGSGCGPLLSQVRHIDLRDGRGCDYRYDGGRLIGLWCDERSGWTTIPQAGNPLCDADCQRDAKDMEACGVGCCQGPPDGRPSCAALKAYLDSLRGSGGGPAPDRERESMLRMNAEVDQVWAPGGATLTLPPGRDGAALECRQAPGPVYRWTCGAGELP